MAQFILLPYTHVSSNQLLNDTGLHGSTSNQHDHHNQLLQYTAYSNYSNTPLTLTTQIKTLPTNTNQHDQIIINNVHNLQHPTLPTPIKLQPTHITTISIWPPFLTNTIHPISTNKLHISNTAITNFFLSIRTIHIIPQPIFDYPNSE